MQNIIRSRTLMFVQAVDPNDPLFGFFVSWLRAFAEYGDAIVGALRVDQRVALPENITVQALRPPHGSRFDVLANVLRMSWNERHTYDSVFVRGDAIYVVIAGWLWRLLGKKVVFWYAHYSAKSPLFWIASWIASEIVTSVPEANPSPRAISIGQHVDVTPYESARVGRVFRPSGVLRLLIVGRITGVKRVPWLMEHVKQAFPERSYHLTIVGPAATEEYAKQVEACLAPDMTWIREGVAFEEIKKYYLEADVVLSANPASLDKAIVEAVAAGCLVIAATPALRRGLESPFHWLQPSTDREWQTALMQSAKLSSSLWETTLSALFRWVKQHELKTHLEALTSLLQERTRVTLSLRTWVKRLRNRLFPATRPLGVPVLMFHAFDGRGSSAWDPTRLRALVTRLHAKGVSIIPLSEAMSDTSTVSTVLAMTIDDATEDLRLVKPFFHETQTPATIFAPSELGVLENSEGINRVILKGKELASLIEGTRLEIGGHGVTHQKMTVLDNFQAMQEIESSYRYARTFQSHETPLFFAYPRGKYRAEHAEYVLKAGFAGAFTVKPGYWAATTPAGEIPRLPIMNWMTSADVMHLLGYRT